MTGSLRTVFERIEARDTLQRNLQSAALGCSLALFAGGVTLSFYAIPAVAGVVAGVAGAVAGYLISWRRDPGGQLLSRIEAELQTKDRLSSLLELPPESEQALLLEKQLNQKGVTAAVLESFMAKFPSLIIAGLVCSLLLFAVSALFRPWVDTDVAAENILRIRDQIVEVVETSPLPDEVKQELKKVVDSLDSQPQKTIDNASPQVVTSPELFAQIEKASSLLEKEITRQILTSDKQPSSADKQNQPRPTPSPASSAPGSSSQSSSTAGKESAQKSSTQSSNGKPDAQSQNEKQGKGGETSSAKSAEPPQQSANSTGKAGDQKEQPQDKGEGSSQNSSGSGSATSAPGSGDHGSGSSKSGSAGSQGSSGTQTPSDQASNLLQELKKELEKKDSQQKSEQQKSGQQQSEKGQSDSNQSSGENNSQNGSSQSNSSGQGKSSAESADKNGKPSEGGQSSGAQSSEGGNASAGQGSSKGESDKKNESPGSGGKANSSTSNGAQSSQTKSSARSAGAGSSMSSAQAQSSKGEGDQGESTSKDKSSSSGASQGKEKLDRDAKLKDFEPGDEGKEGGVKGNNATFEEKMVKQNDDALDLRYSGQESSEVDSEVAPESRLKIEQMELPRVKPRDETEEQGIPPEYESDLR